MNEQSTLDKTLEERASRYGSFETHSILSQTLNQVILKHASKYQKQPMQPYMMEAIMMVCHKLARIANGDPYYDDNWHDIAGYAQRVHELLNRPISADNTNTTKE